jgi:hypothetical protein
MCAFATSPSTSGLRNGRRSASLSTLWRPGTCDGSGSVAATSTQSSARRRCGIQRRSIRRSATCSIFSALSTLLTDSEGRSARRYRSPGDRAEPSRRPLACPPGQRRPAAVRRPQADSTRPRLDARRPRSCRLLRSARGHAGLPPPTGPRRTRAAGRRNLARSWPPVGTRVLPLQARRSRKTWPLGSMSGSTSSARCACPRAAARSRSARASSSSAVRSRSAARCSSARASCRASTASARCRSARRFAALLAKTTTTTSKTSTPDPCPGSDEGGNGLEREPRKPTEGRRALGHTMAVLEAPSPPSSSFAEARGEACFARHLRVAERG